jgi:hypothetical protein
MKIYYLAHCFALVSCTLLFITACSTDKPETFSADFGLLEENLTRESSEDVGVFGGSARVRRKPVEAGGATWEVLDGDLALEFEENGYFSIHPPVMGLPASWEGISSMSMELESNRDHRIFVEIYGRRSRTRDTLDLEPGISRHRIDTREVPLLGGINTEPDRIRITSELPGAMIVKDISLIEGDEQVFLVDRFGQRALRDWEGKVHSEEELLDLESENDFLEGLEKSDETLPMDRFGGYADRNITFEGSGFFRTEYSDGRWWLVTPEGNPFYSMGVNGVRIKSFRSNMDVTYLEEGRKSLFEEIPAYEDCPVCFREEGKYFSFYSWNVTRKYADLDQWKDQTDRRLRAAGFNTVGNWSDTLYYHDATMPYTYTLDTRKDPGFVMSNKMPDVFHPGWEDHLNRVFSGASVFRDDPFLLGYFVDNEMGWGSVASRPDSSSYTYEALKDLEDEQAIRGAYAERYFSTVKAAIKKHDPNHLYMGCRFTRRFRNMGTIAEAAGRHLDVLSINVYSAYPIREQMDEWHNATRLPMLIGEHHIPPRTARQLWPRYPNFPQEERDEMITNYVRTWASYPYSLGSHWYQYKDQEVAGREEGGENQPVGLVTIADQCNRRLLEVYREISNSVPGIMGLESR